MLLRLRRLVRAVSLWGVVVGLALAWSSGATASSYVDTNGNVIDPIEGCFGPCFPLTYSGPNLGPFVSLGNVNLSYANLPGADLRGANLDGANLYHADLPGADLSNASFVGAELGSATFYGANLFNADFSGTGWSGGDFWNANASYADFSHASFYLAYMNGGNFRHANLSFTNPWSNPQYGPPTCSYGNTDFSYANFSGAIINGAMNGPCVISVGAFYSVDAVDSDGNPIPDTIFSGFDPIAAGWTLIPEPNTALLLGIGMMGLGMRRRTRRGC